MDVVADLVAEQDRLEVLLGGLDEEAWSSPSAATGWTVSDVVLHLAQTEEAVVASALGVPSALRIESSSETLDGAMDRLVAAERSEPTAVFDRWRRARRAAVDALRSADPQRPLPWAAAPLKPRTLATTRLAEHWAHGLDIAEPLRLPWEDTDRLRHVAWLGHGSLRYAFSLRGEPAPDVCCVLTAPSGAIWRYGPADAPSSISGSAGAFCRVGAQRLRPDASGLVTGGPSGAAALAVLRNYAA
jgi:uncharacterized protein (TIGR03084 family)